jgi:hypothetical protein
VAVAAYYNGSSWTWASGPLLNQTISLSPAVSWWGSGRLDMFARGAGGDPVHLWYSSSTWTGPESLGGQIF